jgi:hypothetical protein
MATPHFDFGPLRDTAIGLLKQFGRKAPIVLLRNVNETPADPTQPWLGAKARVRTFQFFGTVSTIGFPKKSDPGLDHDVDIIAAGDVVTTAADSSVPGPAFPPDLGVSMSVKLGVGGFGSIHGGGDLGISMQAALSLTPLCGEPLITDRLLIDGQYYAIMGVTDITPDDKVIIFKIRARAWPGLPHQGGAPY